MRHANVLNTQIELERFEKALEEYHIRYSTDDNFRKYVGITGFKETAALKRASLDLSRALTDLRRP